MKQALIGTAISLLLSACLYFGQGSLHQFAFYVAAATNVLCWLLIFAGGIKGQGAALTTVKTFIFNNLIKSDFRIGIE
ncbi:hypothetical protein QOZ65_33065, partial [Pseudomonas aeruginosa]|nr:hypothetical protein [Pseudomonas aeruginosa]